MPRLRAYDRGTAVDDAGADIEESANSLWAALLNEAEVTPAGSVRRD